MSELNHKLDQLKLCSMCQELDHVLTDAATKNLSHAETIEWLADIELDGRRNRSIGNPGTGKTFLSKIIGWRACQANQRILFTTAMNMLNQLVASQVDHSLVRKLKVYTDPSLIICDELGYLSLDQQTSNLFYQVISTRHAEHRSTIITTNTPFSEWGNILFNTTIATAIADRLVENSEIYLLGGPSVRKPKRNQLADEE
jgi:DNA replication protein DnaC